MYAMAIRNGLHRVSGGNANYLKGHSLDLQLGTMTWGTVYFNRHTQGCSEYMQVAFHTSPFAGYEVWNYINVFMSSSVVPGGMLPNVTCSYMRGVGSDEVVLGVHCQIREGLRGCLHLVFVTTPCWGD